MRLRAGTTSATSARRTARNVPLHAGQRGKPRRKSRCCVTKRTCSRKRSPAGIRSPRNWPVANTRRSNNLRSLDTTTRPSASAWQTRSPSSIPGVKVVSTPRMRSQRATPPHMASQATRSVGARSELMRRFYATRRGRTQSRRANAPARAAMQRRERPPTPGPGPQRGDSPAVRNDPPTLSTAAAGRYTWMGLHEVPRDAGGARAAARPTPSRRAARISVRGQSHERPRQPRRRRRS